MPRKDGNKKVLVVSDLHVGHVVGLMPKKVVHRVGGEENTHRPNGVQKRFLKLWQTMIREVGDVDFCVVNGDSCDGPNRKSGGLGLWTTDLSCQADTAAELLRMIPAKQYLVTEGSGYHTGENMSLDQAVAERLDGTYGTELALKVNGVRLHFSHYVGVSTSSWQYRTTPVARELVSALLNEKEYGHFDGVIRSHAHYYVHVEFGSQFGCITPCWKGRDDYVAKKGMALLPKIGYVMFEISPDGEISRRRHLWSLKRPMLEVSG